MWTVQYYMAQLTELQSFRVLPENSPGFLRLQACTYNNISASVVHIFLYISVHSPCVSV